ncbi:hypothetical protein FJZ33_07935, partial [Candidatus Poribacteria bacterium]|nr:hypothetical protein [Candidatus Poribacteria bacterium]
WDSDNKEVKGQISHDGKDTLYFNLQYGLANDGSADGLYVIDIKVTDKKNNEGNYRWRFFVDTTPAKVDSVYPANGALVNKPLSSVWAKISDSASGIDIEKSRISLRGTDLVYGSGEVKGSMVNNGIDTISLKLSRPESLVDGLYTISVMPMDMQGNMPPEEIQSTFKYDTNAPVVVSSQPSSGSVLSIPLKQVKVTLSDGDANKTSGIDLNACSLSLSGPKGNIAGNLTAVKPNVLTLDINSDGFIDGNYIMSIITQDLAGNRSNPINISFSYVTKAPALISVQPDNGALLNKPISLVTIKLKDNSGAGLDLANCKVSAVGPGNKTLSGKLSFTEPDTIFFALDRKFATDGTDDGIYRLDIRADDKAGTGFNYKTTFVYDTLSPTGKMTFPEGDIINKSFDYVAVKFDDIHSGINLEKCLLNLIGPGGPVSGALVNDGVSTVKLKFSPLPIDSSMDGKYSLNAVPMDLAGNAPVTPLVYSFVYDTAPPVIKSSIPGDKSSVFVQLNSVVVTLEDSGSGVDLEKSSIKLFGPDGRQIPGVRKDNGNNIVLTFPTLVDSGNYTISIIARDRIGNIGKEQNLSFIYLPTAPSIVGLTIEDSSYKVIGMKEVEDRPYTAIPMKRVVARLEDRSGSGIDLENSWIKLWGPDNRSLTGKLFSKGNDNSNIVATIFYELPNPLANDGSVDGLYIIEINAVDKKGNRGDYKREFFYDTTSCEIAALFISSAVNKIDILQTLPFGGFNGKFGMINR